MELNKLYRLSREAQGVKQSTLVKKIGISQSSISQFENGQSTLSLETLLAIAPLLNLNPRYLMGDSSNPFYGSDLIKMFLPEQLLMGVDYAPLEFVVKANSSVQVVFLMVTSGLDRILAKTVVGQLTFAVLLRDQDGNTFIFRRRSKNSYLVGEVDLQARLQAMAKDDKRVSIQAQRISRTLSKKIADWTVMLKDVQDIFESKISKTLSLGENRVIELMRAEGHHPEDVERYLRNLKKKKNP